MLARDPTALRLTAADWMYAAAAPCVFGLVWLGARMMGAGRDELHERTGAMPDAGQPVVWFHGASAGEMAGATRLAALLREHGHRFTAAYTATNRAGVDFISRVGGPEDVTAFVPWDVPRWVARALDHWRPQALVLVETELWPRLILEAYRRNVPVFCASARIYPRDVPRYRAIRALIIPTLRRLAGLLAQNETERERFVTLGAPPERCFASGNLKYVGMDSAISRDLSFRAELGLRVDHRVVVLGSVHADEMGVLLAAIAALRVGNLRVIIAPRHPSAGAAIVAQCVRRGWVACRRSDPRPSEWQMLVLDSMGELARAYAIAAMAVVGGGFGNHGGHNVFEPLMCGAPVIFGRHVEHFASEAQALTDATPEVQVTDATQLSQLLAEWLADDVRRRRVLALQRQVLPDGRAIASRYLAALSPCLEGRCT